MLTFTIARKLETTTVEDTNNFEGETLDFIIDYFLLLC